MSTEASEVGSPPPDRRLTLDAEAERSTAALRLLAAGLVAAGATVVALTATGLIAWLTAFVGGVATLGWVASARRSRARARHAPNNYLELLSDTLVLADGARRLQVSWQDVRSVEVDEDRLAIQLELAPRQGGPHPIEPRYGGMGVYELREAIHRHWLAAVGFGEDAQPETRPGPAVDGQPSHER